MSNTFEEIKLLKLTLTTYSKSDRGDGHKLSTRNFRLSYSFLSIGWIFDFLVVVVVVIVLVWLK